MKKKRSLFLTSFVYYSMIIVVAFLLFIGSSFYSYYTSMLSNHRTSLRNVSNYVLNTAFWEDYSSIGTVDNKYMDSSIKTFENYYDIEFWFTDIDGNIIATSPNATATVGINVTSYKSNILSTDYLKGTLNGTFDSTTLSLTTKVYSNNNHVGYLLLHKTITGIFNETLALFKFTFFSVLIIFVLSLVFVFIVSKSITTPLKEINEIANNYGAGNFDVDVNLSTPYNEIDTIALSLKNMAKQLDNLEEYRKDFIANVSHDFRSPLTSIKGYITAILDGTVPPKSRQHYLKIILHETERLTRLTSNVLTLTTISSTETAETMEPFSITNAIKETVISLDKYLALKQIQLSLDLPDYNVFVLGHQERIKQVIYNLLDNATKFSYPQGKIIISVNITGKIVKTSVIDFGTGIAEASINHIWERFYKSDASRGMDKRGTGLGLSIVKEIIKAHGQQVTVSSKEGVGTTFTFTLNLSKLV